MPYLLFLKKRQNLILSSAANYRWRFMGYLFTYWIIFHAFVVNCRLLSKSTFSKKSLSGIPGCQTVWILIRPNILLSLIWVQTVCKDYQQTIKVAACSERVKKIISQGIMLYFNKILKIQYT